MLCRLRHLLQDRRFPFRLHADTAMSTRRCDGVITPSASRAASPEASLGKGDHARPFSSSWVAWFHGKGCHSPPLDDLVPVCTEAESMTLQCHTPMAQ